MGICVTVPHTIQNLCSTEFPEKRFLTLESRSNIINRKRHIPVNSSAAPVQKCRFKCRVTRLRFTRLQHVLHLKRVHVKTQFLLYIHKQNPFNSHFLSLAWLSSGPQKLSKKTIDTAKVVVLYSSDAQSSYPTNSLNQSKAETFLRRRRL